jgi:tripartite-type tricarboxylate transporter receptor subunit TctC
VGVPRNTPAGIVATLNSAINAGLVDPSIQARLADIGSAPFASSPAEFAKLIAEETEKWGKVVRFAGIKPD